jgi:hypothetical protein
MWIIEYYGSRPSRGGPSVDTQTVASCDGTNIYVVEIQNDEANRAVWADDYERVKDSLPRAVAAMFLGTYPPPEQPTLQHIWLAFASHCILNEPSGTTKPLTAVDLALFYDTNFVCNYSWELDTERAMRRLTFSNASFFLQRASTDGKVRRLKYESPYDAGFIEGVGLWTNESTILGQKVATQCVFSSYFPRFDNNTRAECVRTMSFKCVATNIDRSVITQIPPPLPEGRVLVTDRRLANNGGSRLDYILTNGWAGASESMLALRARHTPQSSLEEEVLDTFGIKRPSTSLMRIIVWIVLAAPSSLLLASIVFKRLKIKTPSQYENKQRR